MKENTEKNAPGSLAMLTASMIIFGTIGVFRRFIPLSSGMIAFFRGIIGALFLMLFAKARGRKLRNGTEWKTTLWLAVSGGVIGFNWILLFEAYNYTTVSTATLCYYMQPTIVVIASTLLFSPKSEKWSLKTYDLMTPSSDKKRRSLSIVSVFQRALPMFESTVVS